MKHYMRKLLLSENLIADLLQPRIGAKKRILIDYSSPNIAKQFHVGNFRSTLIGRFIDSINRAAGNDVISFNYLGDWGTQFAMIAALWPEFRPSNKLWQSYSDLEKLKMLTECYVKANALQRKDEEFTCKVRKISLEMEEQFLQKNFDYEFLKFWSEVRNISLNHLNTFYREFNVHHDVTSGESEDINGAKEVVENLITRGITKETADGLTVGTVPSQSGYVILKKSDGATLYLTRDLASILRRDEVYAADRYLYVVDKSQTRHFEFMKALLHSLGKDGLADKIEHIPFGRVIGLSTRQGRTEAVADIFERGVTLAEEFVLQSNTLQISQREVHEVAKILSVSVVIVNDLKRHRTSEYNFTFDGAYKMKQVNGLLLQMKHSRLVSLEKYNESLMQNILSDWDYELEVSPQTLPLINHIHAFDDALFASFTLSEPCKVTSYLLKLANLVGSTMGSLRVSGEPVSKALPRLFLFATAKKILHEGMKLLGIEPLERM